MRTDGPITTKRAAAKVLGVSEDTLARTQKRFGDRMVRPWWRDAEAVISWWTSLIAPPIAEPPKKRTRAPVADVSAAVDPREVARDLARGR